VYVFGPPGYVSQRYGSEAPHPDPFQNVTDPNTAFLDSLPVLHCFFKITCLIEPTWPVII
jgi:hypothetical protein